MSGEFEKRSSKEVGAFLRRLRTSLGWTLEDVVEQAEKRGVALTTSTLSRAERGIATLSPAALVAICDTYGISLDQIEDVIRSAYARREVELIEWTFDELMDEAKKAAHRGRVAKVRDLLVSAEDRVSLHPTERPSDEALIRLRLWLATACVKLGLTHLARRYAVQVLNAPSLNVDDLVEALITFLTIALHDADHRSAGIFAREVESHLGAVSDDVRARALYEIGRYLVEERSYSRAVERLDLARRLFSSLGRDVESLRVGALLGYALARTGKVSRGKRLIESVLRFAPRAKNPEIHLWARWQLGRLMYFLGDPDAGAEQLRQAALTARAQELHATEFEVWYTMWRLERARENGGRSAPVERTLKRLLKRVGQQTPEARMFVRYLQGREGRLEEGA